MGAIYEAHVVIEAKSQREASEKIHAALKQVGKVIGMGVAKRGSDDEQGS